MRALRPAAVLLAAFSVATPASAQTCNRQVFEPCQACHALAAGGPQKPGPNLADLIGRKVGCKSFQASAILWMRGILEHEYGVPHKSIQWFAELDEDIEFTPHKDLNITRLPHNSQWKKSGIIRKRSACAISSGSFSCIEII